MIKKKTTKTVPKSKTITKNVSKESVSEPIYDEFGFCISCKGGKEGCLHTNLVQDKNGTSCINCGLIIQ